MHEHTHTHTHTSAYSHLYTHKHTVKGHTRKGHAYLGLKDTVKAEQAFAKALELDPNNTVSSQSSHISQHLLAVLPHYQLIRFILVGNWINGVCRLLCCLGLLLPLAEVL